MQRTKRAADLFERKSGIESVAGKLGVRIACRLVVLWDGWRMCGWMIWIRRGFAEILLDVIK